MKTREPVTSEKSLQMGQSCACFNLRKAARLVTQVFDRALKPSGLRATQFSVLNAINYKPGILVSPLAAILGMDRTTLTRNLKVLEKQDLVRIEEGDDRREHRIELTDRGRAALVEALPFWEEAQTQVTSAIGDESWRDLLGGLQTLTRKLD